MVQFVGYRACFYNEKSSYAIGYKGITSVHILLTLMDEEPESQE